MSNKLLKICIKLIVIILFIILFMAIPNNNICVAEKEISISEEHCLPSAEDIEKTQYTLEEYKNEKEEIAKALQEEERKILEKQKQEKLLTLISTEEKRIFAGILQLECLGAGCRTSDYKNSEDKYNNLLATATVIINRKENGYWGDTFKEVLSSPKQFSTYKSALSLSKNKISEECYEAIDIVLLQAKKEKILSEDYLYFCYKSSVKRFENSNKSILTTEGKVRYGDDYFYRSK